MNHSCDRFRRRKRKWPENALSLTAEKYPLIKRTPEISTIEDSLSTMECSLLVQLVEGLSQILAGVRSSPLDKTLQCEHHLHALWYIKVMNFIILRKLFDYQSLQSMCTLHLLQYIDIREPAINHNFAACAVINGCQPVMDQQCSLLMCPSLASVETAQCHLQIGADIKVTSTQASSLTSARINSPPRLAEASPLPDSNIVSCLCDHNGGIITSEDGIKLTIPEGAIKDGDLVTFHIATGLFGPFVLPSKCQTDLASPYYWIGVNGSYHFHRPVKVEFEHFGACDPSHYKLLCCEDYDESYTMQPVEYDVEFTVDGYKALCTFHTNHFCSYCLLHDYEDIGKNRVGAFYLKPKNYQCLRQFTVEIWFSFAIACCMKRNEELYIKRGMVLHSSHIIIAHYYDTHYKDHLLLDYTTPNTTGWYLNHSKSTIQTQEVNFHNYYTKAEDLKVDEEMLLFPPRFVINVGRTSHCTNDLHTNIKVVSHSRYPESEIQFNLLVFIDSKSSVHSQTVPVSSNHTLLFINSHHCEENKSKLQDLELYSNHISSHWREVAIYLGISKRHISTINIDNPCIKDKCSKMLRIWLERTTSPCWCNFVDALIDCGLYDVAEEAAKHLQESPSKIITDSPDTDQGRLHVKDDLQTAPVKKLLDTSKSDLYVKEKLQKSTMDIDEHKQLSVAALDDLKKPALVPTSSDATAETGYQFTVNDLMQLSADLEAVCPLKDSEVMLHTCDYNGGVLLSKDGSMKITVPKGAIRRGDLVLFATATDLFSSFILPSKCEVDLASPYYWIRVTGSYHFHKPVQVEFEHYGACDPSHYQLLCCEDDDESYTMQHEVDRDLQFTVRGDISLCIFETQHFCSCCLCHSHKDPMINRIGAYYLKPKKFLRLDHFSVEIWFSLVISKCSKRNRELYTKRQLVLEEAGCSYIFEAACGKSSGNYFFLEYENIDGWHIDHSLSKKIPTKKVNFYNNYKRSEDLQASEEDSSFPPRFIINVAKSSECNTDLNTNIIISLYDDEGEVVDCSKFQLFVPISILTSTVVSVRDGTSGSPIIGPHSCDNNRPKLADLSKYKTKISTRWKEVALNLGISEDRVSIINTDHPNIEDKCHEMFKWWLQTRSTCWCQLIQALCACDVSLQRVADEVKTHLTYDSTSAATLLDGKDEKELFLNDIPESKLNYFIKHLLPKKSAIAVIKDIRSNPGSKEDSIKKVYEEFSKQEDPSWTKIHRALIKADCDDLADYVEAFLPV